MPTWVSSAVHGVGRDGIDVFQWDEEKTESGVVQVFGVQM
jgi:hypothetical protein